MVKAFLAVGAAAAAFVGAQASAATYVFNYTFATSGNTVTGSLEGTLAADNNTFNITGLNSYLVNGVATNATSVVGADSVYGLNMDGPSLKLDESFLNFAITPTIVNQIAVFGVGNSIEAGLGFPTAAATVNFGGDDRFNAFDPAAFSGAIAGAGAGVPEPAAWALMIGGFGVVGSSFRRRKVATKVSFA